MQNLMLLSGWANPAESLNPLTAALSEHFEIRGISLNALLELGLVSPPADPTRSPYASGLLRMLESVDGPVVLAGWSMGGLVALEATPALGERLAGLIMLNSTSRFCSCEGYAAGAATAELRAFTSGFRDHPEAILSAFFQTVAAPYELAEAELKQQVVDALSLGTEHLEHGLAYLERKDLRELLHGVRARSLLIHGMEDKVIPHAASEYMAQQLPSATLLSVEDMGHDLPRRDPGRIAHSIAQMFA